MAYGAYQIAAPAMSLQDQLIRGRGRQDVGAEVATKKRSLKQDLLEKMQQRQKSAEKRAGSFLGVEGLGDAMVGGLDLAAGFVDPATAAILGAASGGLSGFNQLRAADKLKGATQGFEQYGFLAPQVQNIRSQIEEQQKGVGDVLMSAGTQALQNFAMGEAMKGISGDVAKEPITKTKDMATTKVKTPDFIKQQRLDLDKLSGKADKLIQQTKYPALDPLSKKLDTSKLLSDFKAQKLRPATLASGTPKGIDVPYKGLEGAEVAKKGYEGAEAADWLKKLQEGQGFDMNMFEGMSPEEILSNITTIGGAAMPMLEGLLAGEQYPQIDYSSLY